MRHFVTSSRIVTALLVVLASGCSSSSSSSTTDGGGGGQTGFTAEQLCALVTTADVSAAVGTTVNAGVPNGVNAPSCDWQSPDAQVAATIAAASPSEVGQIPPGLQNVSGAHVDPVPNLGDSASFAAAATGPDGEIDMAKNGRAVTITIGNSDPSFDQATQKTDEITLAQAAVKNM